MPWRWFSVWVFGLACFVLSACRESSHPKQDLPSHRASGVPDSDWPLARGGAGLSGRVRALVPRNPAVVWEFQVDSPINGEATVSDGHLAFGTDRGMIHLLNAETGKLSWTKEFDHPVEAAPAFHEALLYAGCGDGTLYALVVDDGEVRWTLKTEDKITAGVNLAPAPNGDSTWVLLNGYDGLCRAIQAETGQEVWHYQTEEFINGTPALIDQSRLVFGGCDRQLYTLDLATGRALVTLENDAEIVSSVATDGSFVAWGNYGNQIVAADIARGEILWTYRDRQFPFMGAPGIDDTTVYAGSRDKKLHAIDRVSGEARWKFKTRGRLEGSPIIFDDAVVIGSSDGRLYAITVDTGELIWALDLGESLVAPPSFAQGKIFIGSEDGTMFAVGESS